MLDDLLERSKDEYIAESWIAELFFLLGEEEKGFEWLDKAYEERDFHLIFLRVDPAFDSVRSDPRFIALLKKIGLDK